MRQALREENQSASVQIGPALKRREIDDRRSRQYCAIRAGYWGRCKSTAVTCGA